MTDTKNMTAAMCESLIFTDITTPLNEEKEMC
jgi:hypothetical protein